MGGPCEPRTERQELIAALEEAGYDMLADVPADWRFSKTDQELRALADTFGTGDGAEAEPPDISDLVEAIREVSKYAWLVEPTVQGPPADHWRDAIARLRELLAVCDKAMEASGS